MGPGGRHLAGAGELYATNARLQHGFVEHVRLLCPHSHTAYYGILFPGGEEAAFSNFRLLEATGSVVAYTLSPVLCTGTKLVVLAVLMLVGMVGFATVDCLRRKELAASAVELRSAKAEFGE